jgi:flagellum-specific peptidoglycan hydrolase FlgJ
MAGVYATSPAYAKSILNTIRANNLTKYDGV